MELTQTMHVPKKVRDQIIFERDSEKMKKAADESWKKYHDIDARRFRNAPAHYALQVKRHGKAVAWEWLKNKFGEEQAETFLIAWSKKKK